MLGIFIEPLPALLLTAPLLLPLASAVRHRPRAPRRGHDRNLAIALYTPPVGGTLFVAAKLANAGIGAMTRAILPLMAISIAILMVITYVPAVGMALVYAVR